MREKLLRIAKRIEAVENECNVDLMRPREILCAVREAIEEELAPEVLPESEMERRYQNR